MLSGYDKKSFNEIVDRFSSLLNSPNSLKNNKLAKSNHLALCLHK